MREPKRWLRAGRATFNAAAELCAVLHPDALGQKVSTGNSACGLCYQHMKACINNPVGKKREWNGLHRWRLILELRDRERY